MFALKFMLKKDSNVFVYIFLEFCYEHIKIIDFFNIFSTQGLQIKNYIYILQ